MTKIRLAALESALRERHLDRTLSSALPLAGQGHSQSRTPTLVDRLDTCLLGGLPRGQLCELTGAHSSGRTTLLLHLLAGVTARGEIAALIDTTDCFDVASAHAAGIDLTRVLWVRGYTTSRNDRAQGALSALDRAIKALNLVLQAGGFGVVAIDLADVPLALLKRLPFTTWLRLQRAVEGSETTCVLIVQEPIARSAGGLTVSLAAQTTWDGIDRQRRLTGAGIAAQVRSPRRHVNGDVTFDAVAGEAP
jgi:recombination protein RecA